MQKQETFFKREVIIELSQMFNHFGPGTEIDQQIYKQKKIVYEHTYVYD